MAARSTFTRSAGNTITAALNNSIRDHLVTTTTSDDVASEGQMCVNTSTNQLVIHNGTSAVQFGGYGTPNAITSAFFSQTGFVVNSATTTGEWTRYGTHYVCTGVLAINSVTSAGTAGNVIGFYVSDLPAVTTQRCVGSFVMQDASAGTVWGGGLIMLPGSNVMNMYGPGTSGLGTNPSFGLNASDTVWFSISYHDI